MIEPVLDWCCRIVVLFGNEGDPQRCRFANYGKHITCMYRWSPECDQPYVAPCFTFAYINQHICVLRYTSGEHLRGLGCIVLLGSGINCYTRLIQQMSLNMRNNKNMQTVSEMWL